MLIEVPTEVVAGKKSVLPILSIVIPSFNEADSLPHTIAKLSVLLDAMVSSGEVSSQSYLFFVDDGSTDQTWSILRLASAGNRRVCGLRLSRNFGHQPALLAGLSEVCNDIDVAISIDADLQQDPEAMREFVRRYKEGADGFSALNESSGPIK